MSSCLWCGDNITTNRDDDYRFCETCLENLEELEAVTISCNVVEKAQILLIQDQE